MGGGLSCAGTSGDVLGPRDLGPAPPPPDLAPADGGSGVDTLPHGCTADTITDPGRCFDIKYWSSYATKLCGASGAGRVAYDFVGLDGCGPGVFHGVAYRCCPKPMLTDCVADFIGDNAAACHDDAWFKAEVAHRCAALQKVPEGLGTFDACDGGALYRQAKFVCCREVPP